MIDSFIHSFFFLNIPEWQNILGILRKQNGISYKMAAEIHSYEKRQAPPVIHTFTHGFSL